MTKGILLNGQKCTLGVDGNTSVLVYSYSCLNDGYHYIGIVFYVLSLYDDTLVVVTQYLFFTLGLP